MMNPRIDITDYITGEQFFSVEVVSEDDLPRGCDFVSSAVNESDCVRYEIYKNCVDKMFYAIKEKEE